MRTKILTAMLLMVLVFAGLVGLWSEPSEAEEVSTTIDLNGGAITDESWVLDETTGKYSKTIDPEDPTAFPTVTHADRTVGDVTFVYTFKAWESQGNFEYKATWSSDFPTTPVDLPDDISEYVGTTLTVGGVYKLHCDIKVDGFIESHPGASPALIVNGGTSMNYITLDLNGYRLFSDSGVVILQNSGFFKIIDSEPLKENYYVRSDEGWSWYEGQAPDDYHQLEEFQTAINNGIYMIRGGAIGGQPQNESRTDYYKDDTTKFITNMCGYVLWQMAAGANFDIQRANIFNLGGALGGSIWLAGAENHVGACNIIGTNSERDDAGRLVANDVGSFIEGPLAFIDDASNSYHIRFLTSRLYITGDIDVMACNSGTIFYFQGNPIEQKVEGDFKFINTKPASTAMLIRIGAPYSFDGSIEVIDCDAYFWIGTDQGVNAGGTSISHFSAINSHCNTGIRLMEDATLQNISITNCKTDGNFVWMVWGILRNITLMGNEAGKCLVQSGDAWNRLAAVVFEDITAANNTVKYTSTFKGGIIRISTYTPVFCYLKDVSVSQNLMVYDDGTEGVCPALRTSDGDQMLSIVIDGKMELDTDAPILITDLPSASSWSNVVQTISETEQKILDSGMYEYRGYVFKKADGITFKESFDGYIKDFRPRALLDGTVIATMDDGILASDVMGKLLLPTNNLVDGEPFLMMYPSDGNDKIYLKAAVPDIKQVSTEWTNSVSSTADVKITFQATGLGTATSYNYKIDEEEEGTIVEGLTIKTGDTVSFTISGLSTEETHEISISLMPLGYSEYIVKYRGELIYSDPEAVPQVSINIGSQTCQLGGTATDIVATSSPVHGGTLSYKWYVSNDYSGWSEIQSATQSSYTPTTSKVGTTYYFVEVTETAAEQTYVANSKISTVITEGNYRVLFYDTDGTTRFPDSTMFWDGLSSIYLPDPAEYGTNTYDTYLWIDMSTGSLKSMLTPVEPRDYSFKLYASSKEYIIGYALDGGTNSEANPSSYRYNSPTITFEPATKSGYTFNGWFTDSELTNRITQIPSGSQQNYQLYASWSVAQTVITFIIEGAQLQEEAASYYEQTYGDNCEISTEGSVTTMTITFVQPGFLIMPDKADIVSSVEGQVLISWVDSLDSETRSVSYDPGYCLNTSGMESVTLYPILAVATNIVLTAEGDSIFRANTPSSDGIGVRSADGKTLTITLQPGESWRPASLYNGGNQQQVYFIDGQGNILLRSTTFHPSENGGNLEYTVVWRDFTSYLKLNANGGEITVDKIYTAARWCGATIGLASNNASATYAGYTFDGWYTAQSGGTLLPVAGFVYTKEMRDSMSTVVIEGQTYYQIFAHWKGHISYQTLEGTYTESSESYPAEYTPSSGSVEIGGVSKPGYTFGGWYYDEQYQTPLSLKEGHDDIWLMDTTKVSPCTLYAKWVALPEIDITFLDDDQEIVPSITILPDRPTIFDQAPISVPAGKAFDGWTATLQGSETLIPLGSTASISLDDCTLDPDTQRYTIDLQAHYTEKFYVIVYELDGGSFKNKPRYEFSSSDTFTIAQPIKTGYQFTGWLGTITDSVQYSVKVEACTQDVTLVALWTPIHFDVGVTYVDQVEGTTGETSDKVAATYSPVVSNDTNGYLAVSYKTSIHYDISVTAENAVLFDQGNNSYIFSNATAGVLITITISDPNVPSTDEPDVFYVSGVVMDNNGTADLTDDFYKFEVRIAAETGSVLEAGTLTVTCTYYVDAQYQDKAVKVYGNKDIDLDFDGSAGTYSFALGVGEIPYWAKSIYATHSTMGVIAADIIVNTDEP